MQRGRGTTPSAFLCRLWLFDTARIVPANQHRGAAAQTLTGVAAGGAEEEFPPSRGASPWEEQLSWKFWRKLLYAQFPLPYGHRY
jgi:hypothetical protein